MASSHIGQSDTSGGESSDADGVDFEVSLLLRGKLTISVRVSSRERDSDCEEEVPTEDFDRLLSLRLNILESRDLGRSGRRKERFLSPESNLL